MCSIGCKKHSVRKALTIVLNACVQSLSVSLTNDVSHISQLLAVNRYLSYWTHCWKWCNLLNSISISVNQRMYVNSESCLGTELSSLMIQTTVIHSGFNLFEMPSEGNCTWGHMVWHCVSLPVLHYCMPQVLERKGEPGPFLQWRLLDKSRTHSAAGITLLNHRPEFFCVDM
jgi:hypothetical protein